MVSGKPVDGLKRICSYCNKTFGLGKKFKCSNRSNGDLVRYDEPCLIADYENCPFNPKNQPKK